MPLSADRVPAVPEYDPESVPETVVTAEEAVPAAAETLVAVYVRVLLRLAAAAAAVGTPIGGPQAHSAGPGAPSQSARDHPQNHCWSTPFDDGLSWTLGLRTSFRSQNLSQLEDQNAERTTTQQYLKPWYYYLGETPRSDCYSLVRPAVAAVPEEGHGYWGLGSQALVLAPSMRRSGN